MSRSSNAGRGPSWAEGVRIPHESGVLSSQRYNECLAVQLFETGLIKALVLFLRLLVLPLKVLGTFLLRFKDIVP